MKPFFFGVKRAPVCHSLASSSYHFFDIPVHDSSSPERSGVPGRIDRREASAQWILKFGSGTAFRRFVNKYGCDCHHFRSRGSHRVVKIKFFHHTKCRFSWWWWAYFGLLKGGGLPDDQGVGHLF
jgi:hypothetical protein